MTQIDPRPPLEAAEEDARCAYCGAYLPGPLAVCPDCDDLPALDSPAVSDPGGPLWPVGDRLAGARILADRIGFAQLEAVAMKARRAERLAVWAAALAVSGLVWIGLVCVLHWLGAW